MQSRIFSQRWICGKCRAEFFIKDGFAENAEQNFSKMSSLCNICKKNDYLKYWNSKTRYGSHKFDNGFRVR